MKPLLLLFPFALLFCILPAQAGRADRDQPVHLEADRISVDEGGKKHLLEGNVLLQQGSLTIRTERLTVIQDGEGFQKGIAVGGPGGLARFRQKRDVRDEWVEGEAERIEHDDRALKTQFFGAARLKSGQDEVRGQYISYDGRSENYFVSGAPAGQPGKAGRVRAVIQPKNREASAAAAEAEKR